MNFVQKDFPIKNLALFLTQTCNLGCTYCYGDGGTFGGGENLNEDKAKKAIDWFIEKSQKKVRLNLIFFGGEPFINFPLMKFIVEYVEHHVNRDEKDIRYHVTTNGTFFRDEVLDFIKKYRINVMVSLDGPKEIHDKQRPFKGGKGSFDTIIPGVIKLLDFAPESRAHAVIANNTDPIVIKNYLRSLGFKIITTGILSDSLYDSDKNPDDKETEFFPGVFQDLDTEANQWIEYIKKQDKESLMKLLRDSSLSEGILTVLHNNKKKYPCQAGLDFVAVSCDGDVYPCQRFVGQTDYILGNISSYSLKRDLYYQSPGESYIECINCNAKYYCAGGCKYLNLLATGDMCKPSPDFCSLKKKEFQLSELIVSTISEENKKFLLDSHIFPRKPCPLDFQ